LAYADVYTDLLLEKNIVRSLKSTVDEITPVCAARPTTLSITYTPFLKKITPARLALLCSRTRRSTALSQSRRAVACESLHAAAGLPGAVRSRLRVAALGCRPCESRRVAAATLPRRATANSSRATDPLPTSAVGLLPSPNSTPRQASILPSSKEMLRCAENTCCKRMFKVFWMF
jgi:hypothetical protein